MTGRAGHSHTLIRTIPFNPISPRSRPIFPRSMLIPLRLFTLANKSLGCHSYAKYPGVPPRFATE
jgi:hypothetical protein